MLTELEKKVIALIQKDMPVSRRPYLVMADQAGITEEAFLEILKSLSERGVIRRFGATLRHQKSGFKANAMVAWRVDEDQIEQVGHQMATLREVSHCYHRNPTHQWPYNLYTMVHAKTKSACREIAAKMSKKTSVHQYALLFSVKELKKTSMQYFSDENNT